MLRSSLILGNKKFPFFVSDYLKEEDKVRFRLSQHPPEQIAIAQNGKSEGGYNTHFLKASLQLFPKSLESNP